MFQWDEEKNRTNIEKHGISFRDILPVFQDMEEDSLLIEDTRLNYGEDRFILLRPFQNRLLYVVFTRRGNHIRIISARRASRRERRGYEENRGEQH